MYREDFARKFRHGKALVSLRLEDDCNPDTSWMGEALTHREARQWSPTHAVYSYESDSIRLPSSDIWRDRKGRIVAEPESLDHYDIRNHWRDIEFLKLEAGNYKGERHILRYLFQDADRLRAYYANDWGFVGIVATVRINGREIGNASVWGFESDMDDCEFKAEGRNIAREAIADARQWVKALA